MTETKTNEDMIKVFEKDLNDLQARYKELSAVPEIQLGTGPTGQPVTFVLMGSTDWYVKGTGFQVSEVILLNADPGRMLAWAWRYHGDWELLMLSAFTLWKENKLWRGIVPVDPEIDRFYHIVLAALGESLRILERLTR